MQPKTLSDFYQYANHIIYAVVIAQSYFIANKILIPVQNIQTYEGVVSVYGLLLAYFVIISGWLGHFNSIKRNPHKGRLGNARFVIDLWIVFLAFYLLSLTDKENVESYADTFILVLPIIFGSYFVWDIIKYFEYNSDPESEKKYMNRRTKITSVFLGIFILQSFLYQHAISNLQNLNWDGIIAWDPVFISTSIASIFVYRLVKWKTGYHSRRTKNKKLTKSDEEKND